jgi:molybdenum cofactor biosynthesis protein B
MSESVRRHREGTPQRIGFALITVSTSRFKEKEETGRVADESGDLIQSELFRSGHHLAYRSLVSDNETQIVEAIEGALKNDDVEALITCGGTGVGSQDVTIETVSRLLHKELLGFGELLRRLSFDEIKSASILTRATAGVTKEKKIIFCLPGSPHAARLALNEIIIPEIGHIVKSARGT